MPTRERKQQASRTWKESQDKMNWWIECGDSSSLLSLIPDGSVDALVTDPPAGIAFMGAEWDKDKGGRREWIAWLTGILSKCRRVMKPGAYGWVWALPRTSHWTGTACEDAGFAVRDVMTHVFGTGFPKSRALLKPAAEHWILIKSPGRLRDLRIEACRIPTGDNLGRKLSIKGASGPLSMITSKRGSGSVNENWKGGRWPANFALSHSDDCGNLCADGCPVKELDRQSGTSASGKEYTERGTGGMFSKVSNHPCGPQYADTGTASRFFYVAKPSSSERSAGLDNRNAHPTVKSIGLMRHLVRLVAQPGDLVLDPFAGSGTTGLAALEESCRFVGIEREPHFADISRQRLAHHSRQGRLF